MDNLQQESWQLELIISGFVIFLLIGGWPVVTGLESDLRLLLTDDRGYMPVFFLYMTGRTAYLSLLICLIVHVVMRGLWIAAVGLRSVSGEIDYRALQFRDRYEDWLQRRIGSFDDYLLRLEQYCSVLFSIAFLILFCFLSLGSWALFMIAVQEGISWVTGTELSNNTGVFRGGGWLTGVLFLLSVLYFIDFATLGFFKRNRYTARPYYYLYRFMGWITLARLYRPLYYNLIDQRFGRRLARLLPVFIFLILCIVSVKMVKYAYYPAFIQDGSAFIDSGSYMDEGEWNSIRLHQATLESRFPDHDYVEVFVPYLPTTDNDVLRAIDPGLAVSRYTGMKLEGAFTVGTQSNAKASNDSLLLAFDALHKVSLNGSAAGVKPRFHTHSVREQPGLLYMVPTHDLPPGEHAVRVQNRYLDNGNLEWNEGYRIYFYK
ncbi:hypothetical protein [Lewinella sp. IMCC34191]|uniref:hypothetical protein n=1 Tax=Lewinella sp. IMCC34191 TaxID=2259172 RepID=UPI00130092EC|nr:hypothetical protein [Lewinella sp. IMCC34191]